MSDGRRALLMLALVGGFVGLTVSGHPLGHWLADALVLVMFGTAGLLVALAIAGAAAMSVAVVVWLVRGALTPSPPRAGRPTP